MTTQNSKPSKDNDMKVKKTSTKIELAVFLTPYLLFGVVTLGAGFIFLPMGATIGVGLIFSDAPIYQSSRIDFITFLLISVCLTLLGLTQFKRIWGKLLFMIGVYLWAFIGFIALGMSA